jgi:hypothetical protein
MTRAIALALAVASGFLAGVLLVIVLGATGRPPSRTVTVTRTVLGAVTTPGTIITKTRVPALVGERLNVAKDRVARAGFDVDVQGGGLFGVVVEGNWRVAEQDPTPGRFLEQGSTVHLKVRRA